MKKGLTFYFYQAVCPIFDRESQQINGGDITVISKTKKKHIFNFKHSHGGAVIQGIYYFYYILALPLSLSLTLYHFITECKEFTKNTYARDDGRI